VPVACRLLVDYIHVVGQLVVYVSVLLAASGILDRCQPLSPSRTQGVGRGFNPSLWGPQHPSTSKNALPCEAERQNRIFSLVKKVIGPIQEQAELSHPSMQCAAVQSSTSVLLLTEGSNWST